MLHILLDGADEIGDEVVAFFQDGVDPGENVLHLVFLGDKAVVHQDDDDNDSGENNQSGHTKSSLRQIEIFLHF